MSHEKTTAGTGDPWLSAPQAMLKALFPWAVGTAEVDGAHASPLEQQFGELRDTWKASVEKWSEFAKGASAGEFPTADKLREMFAPASWTGPGAGILDAALRRVLEGPRYATLWDHDRQLIELQRLTLERDKAIAAYQAVVQKAWNRAFERFTGALAQDAEPLGQRTWRGLSDKWLAVANETLMEVHRSDEFVEAQRRMLRAASDRHLQERRIAEACCEAVHLPTRTEVDELQQSVTELRRELRLLRRAATVPAAAAAPVPARTHSPAPAGSARRPAVKRKRT